MNAFSRRPFRTWQIICERLKPYLNKLPEAYHVYYKKLLTEIHALFTPELFADDSPLDGLYLLGYYSQIRKHYSKKNDQQDNKSEEKGGNE
jgi:CRISPR-associated protein Csd1